MACLSCNLIPLSLTFIFSPWVVMTSVTYCLKQRERKLASPTQDRRGTAGVCSGALELEHGLEHWIPVSRWLPLFSCLGYMETIPTPEALVWGGFGDAALPSALPAPPSELRCAGLTAGPGLPTRILPRSAAALPSCLHVTLVLAAVGCWGMSGREFSPPSATEHVPNERVPGDSNIYNWLNVKSLMWSSPHLLFCCDMYKISSPDKND